jgi:hypothetical protein
VHGKSQKITRALLWGVAVLAVLLIERPRP